MGEPKHYLLKRCTAGLPSCLPPDQLGGYSLGARVFLVVFFQSFVKLRCPCHPPSRAYVIATWQQCSPAAAVASSVAQ